MELQKFGVKIFFDTDKDYSSKDFIPVFHNWIQNQLIDNHLLIDVADYSHMIDGPGVMLLAHEGHFSLDQENRKPGILYMRKTNLEGGFVDRFNQVLAIAVNAAKLLKTNNINKRVSVVNNTFRFIANDRLYAENILENQLAYKKEIQKALNIDHPNCKVGYQDTSSDNERLAFSIKIDDEINILE
tara:strand:- start:8240 stop:8797 length:558 start_codon:yes stop_codon:yes gene_type:complete